MSRMFQIRLIITCKAFQWALAMIQITQEILSVSQIPLWPKMTLQITFLIIKYFSKEGILLVLESATFTNMVPRLPVISWANISIYLSICDLRKAIITSSLSAVSESSESRSTGETWISQTQLNWSKGDFQQAYSWKMYTPILLTGPIFRPHWGREQVQSLSLSR